jgi:pimeloyl-ACP methyl ester carboxylesterase
VVNVDGLPALGALFAAIEQPEETPQSFDPSAMVRTMANNGDWHDRILNDMMRSDFAVTGRAMGELTSMDLRDDLARVRVPVLTLGAPAQGMPYSSFEETTRNYESQFTKLDEELKHMAYAPTARHFIMADEPQWMIDQIEEFLNRE